MRKRRRRKEVRERRVRESRYRLLIVDCKALLYKAAYTYSRLDLSAAYGFCKILLGALEELKPTNIAFAWDSKDSARRILYPGYKEKTLDYKARKLKELVQRQSVPIGHILRVNGWTQWEEKLLEADDLIAAWVKRWYPTVIWSGDQDFYQLLTPEVRMWDNSSGFYKYRDFKKEFGIEPIHWVGVKTLAGCRSDKVPPIVKGIGNTTAVNYLRDGKTNKKLNPENIREFMDEVIRNRKLVKLPFKELRPPLPRPVAFDKKQWNQAMNTWCFKSLLL